MDVARGNGPVREAAAGRTVVVIPTLDEEQSIAEVVRSIPRAIVSRVIVADGGSSDACVYRKLRFGRIDDAVRRPWRATRCVRFAEPGGRPPHPGPMTGAFSPYCNSEHPLPPSNP